MKTTSRYSHNGLTNTVCITTAGLTSETIKSFLLTCLALLVISCASGHHKPFDDTVVAKRNIAAMEERLQKAVSLSSHLSMEVIGRVDYPAFNAPIWRISFRPAQSSSKKLMINGGIHGNEPAGVECAVSFVELIAKNADRYNNYSFDIIPLVNPWGWAHAIRFNRAGIDINRDMASLNSQEARIIAESIEGNQYDLMLDLHEDPSAEGFYVYQYGLNEKEFSTKVVDTIQKMGYPIEQNVKMVILKTENGIIDAPMWGLWYMKLTGQLSLSNYYRLYNSHHVLTIETPTRLPFEDRLLIQQTVIELFINEYGDHR